MAKQNPNMTSWGAFGAKHFFQILALLTPQIDIFDPSNMQVFANFVYGRPPSAFWGPLEQSIYLANVGILDPGHPNMQIYQMLDPQMTVGYIWSKHNFFANVGILTPPNGHFLIPKYVNFSNYDHRRPPHYIWGHLEQNKL